ncbi:hypothetical protein ABTX80_22620 [Streptomyces erythrochromogenes]|uniref:hypothetical protein n=1 Tax=Streptomyces erythrochromogenes TaxID=285574 RepID=UPI00332980D9
MAHNDTPEPPILLIHLHGSNEVRVNGLPLLRSEGGPVTLQEIKDAENGMVEVTLTLYARRISP